MSKIRSQIFVVSWAETSSGLLSVFTKVLKDAVCSSIPIGSILTLETSKNLEKVFTVTHRGTCLNGREQVERKL